MKTRFTKSFWLVLSLLLGSVSAWGQDVTLNFGSDFTGNPATYTFPSGDKAHSTGGGFSTSGNNLCNGANRRTQTNSIILELSATSMSELRIPSQSSGGARQLTTIETANAVGGPWTNITTTGASIDSPNTGTSSTCATVVVTGMDIPTGTFVRLTFNGNTNLSSFVITPGGPACTPATASFADDEIEAAIGVPVPGNTFTSDNGSATAYSSSDTDVVTVNASTGAVTLVGEGSATITVKQAVDAVNNICDVTASYIINVAAAPCYGAALGTPGAPTASAAAVDGFTAAWTAVANAVSYTVKVYQGTTMVKNITNAVSPLSVSGLNVSTTYTFTVQAIGDGTTYCNGTVSGNSNNITTLNPPPSSSPCGSSMIMLYRTDFSDWMPVTNQNNSGNPFPVTSGGGAGFTITTDVSVIPGENKLVYASDSERTLTFPSFVFVNGGSVIIRGKNTTNSAMKGITGATSVTDVDTGAAVTIGNIRNAEYNLRFTLPASVNGATALTYSTRGEIYEIIVCTNPGPNCQLSTNPMPNATVAFSAEMGGNSDMQFIELIGFNLSDDVNISISGSGAGRFSVASNTIPRATAAGSIMIPVTFTSSVLAGVSNAVITFTTGSCTPVSVNLSGTSRPAGTGCLITTPANMQIFSTMIITPASKTIVISGINLTSVVNLSVTGANASYFSLSQNSVPASQANGAGKDIIVTFLGGYTAGTMNADLVITHDSGANACSLTVPLQGVTLNVMPLLYTLTLIAQPPAGGTITTDIAGPQYPSGTAVKLVAVAEPGYKFVRWQDITSYSPSRVITMNAHKTITAVFELSETGGAVGDLEAYNITGVTNTSFTANWKAIPGATGYTVNVYEQDTDGSPGTLVQAVIANGQATITANVNGLTPGKAYFYQVVATGTVGTSEMLGSYPIGPLQSITCGEE